MSTESINMKKYEKALLAFAFFQKYAKSGKEFNLSELMSVTKWKERTVKTYVSKKWEEYVEKISGKRYRVSKKFSQVTQEDYLGKFTQSERLRGSFLEEK